MRDSQGTMIAMAAALPCKGRGPDALFLINAPYALNDKVNDGGAPAATPLTEYAVNASSRRLPHSTHA